MSPCPLVTVQNALNVGLDITEVHALLFNI